MDYSETVTLYHGSKYGLKGNIAPVSRERCDFGKGFYMGTERIQPLTLVCNYPKAKLYTLSVVLSELKILDIEVGLEEKELSEEDKIELKKESEKNRSKGISLADEICRKYRRDGMFFDEILKAGE